MREIKFRCWTESAKKMYYPEQLQGFGICPMTGLLMEVIDHGTDGASLEKTQTKDILMQYTGLKDKNGKEIYEHDVILLKDKDYEEKNETAQALSTYEFHCVEFKYGCFKIGGVNLGDYIDGKYLDIIQCGNIYENKEVYRVEEKILSHGEDMNITDITFNISNKK